MTKFHDVLVVALVAMLHVFVLLAIFLAVTMFFVLLAHGIFKPLLSIAVLTFVLAHIAERCFSK